MGQDHLPPDHPPTDPSAETVRIAPAWSDLLASTPGSDDPTLTIRSSAPSVGSRGTATIKAHVVRAAGRPHEGEADYELLELLGEGGMGVVYQARQTAVDREVAVKMLRDDRDNDEARDRFLHEALITSHLEHPNIVPVHDLGSDAAGALFFAMKQVRGRTWRSALSDLSLAEHVDILLRVGDAVAFAHARGVIHRDLKPANVMIGDFGEVQVMDWGLAAAVRNDARGPRLDASTALGGTPAYLPPEVALGQVDRIGVTSDVYLLGACLWEVLTGRPPHVRDNCRDALQAAAENRIAPAAGPEGELHALARQAMADDPAARPATVRAFQQGLRTWESHVESHRLCELAATDLERARQQADDRAFQRAQFGFEQALRLWDGNRAAQEALVLTRRMYAETAFARGDYDLALGLLNADAADQAALVARIRTARDQRARRSEQVRRLGRIAAVLALGLLAIAAWSYVSIGRERDRANAELTTRLRLEAQERARLADITAEAERRTASGLTALAASATGAGDHEADLIAAQQHFQRALFLRPDLASAGDGLRRAALAHADRARLAGQWRQAREKVGLAEAVGLDASAAATAHAAIDAAESRRARELTARVEEILTDAEAPQPALPSDEARAELISLADPVTARLLAERSAGPEGAGRLLALQALPWMAGAEAIPVLLEHLDAPAAADEQAAAIIGLCRIGGDDPGVFYALLSRLHDRAHVVTSIWFRLIRPHWLAYARERVDAFAARDRDTPSPILTMHVAALYGELGEYRKAIAWYEHSLRINPGNNRPREAILECYLALDEHATALALADAMLQRPDFPTFNAYQARANVLLAMGDRPGAIAAARQALVASPDRSFPYVKLAILLADDEPREALTLIARGRSLGTAEEVVDEVLARAHLALGETTPALAALDRLIAADRTQPRWLEWRALIRARLGDEVTAEADLIEGDRRFPSVATFAAMQAWLQARRGETIAARERLKRARTREAQAGWVIAAAALLDGDVIALAKLVDQVDAPVEWRLQLAQAAADRGDAATAMQHADAACAAHPHWAWLRSQRALVRWTIGDRDGALADAQAAVTAQDDNARAWHTLAWLRQQVGDHVGARIACDQAIQRRDEPESRLLRVDIAANLGEWATVRDDVRHLLPNHRLERTTRRLFAMALAATGDVAGARAECQALLDESFDADVALLALHLAAHVGDAAGVDHLTTALLAAGITAPQAAAATRFAPLLP